MTPCTIFTLPRQRFLQLLNILKNYPYSFQDSKGSVHPILSFFSSPVAHVIYCLSCPCNLLYVGQTVRVVQTWFGEQRRLIEVGNIIIVSWHFRSICQISRFPLWFWGGEAPCSVAGNIFGYASQHLITRGSEWGVGGIDHSPIFGIFLYNFFIKFFFIFCC